MTTTITAPAPPVDPAPFLAPGVWVQLRAGLLLGERPVGGFLGRIIAVRPGHVELQLGTVRVAARRQDLDSAAGIRRCQYCGFRVARIHDVDADWWWCSEECRLADRCSEITAWREAAGLRAAGHPQTAGLVLEVAAGHRAADRLGVPAVTR